MAYKRKKMNWKKSRRDFSKKSGIHPRNEVKFNMRGGIRA